MLDVHTALDPNSCGFRLHKLEVYNWGTFDSTNNTFHSIRPDGATSLLVGENGSGKSTLVDAILTLLVRPNVRNYNVAAGAKKRERDERSYIKGACGRLSRSEDNGTNVEFLRPGNRHYSVILACFKNERGDAFTIAQIFYLTADGAVGKMYCYADAEKSIAEHCSGLVETGKMRRQMQDRGFTATDTFSDYARWIEKRTGMLPKAMDMLNQTVAVKDINSLNDFIREHMLEPKPWVERIASLQSHFVQLTEAYQSLVRIRERSEMLKPIAARGGEYLTLASALAKAEALCEAASTFFLQQRIDLFEPAVDRMILELASEAEKRTRIDGEIDGCLEEVRGIKNEIDQAGGERFRQIPLLIKNHELAAQNKRENSTRFRMSLSAAKIKAEVKDATGLAELQASLATVLQSVDTYSRTLKAERDKSVLDRGDAHRRLAEDRRELAALGNRPTKIPEELAELRRSLCDNLRISDNELPFAAELIGVAPEENAWEASAEKLLHSFALSMLVPQRYYAIVAGHLDRTRLTDGRGRGQRLTYLRIVDHVSRARPVPHQKSLFRKLRIKESHPLANWVRGELEERFNFLCCDTVEEFQQASGSALTRERHVKYGNGIRHEKDDRERVIDPRFFVLGWDNRDKRRHLAAEIERLDQQIGSLDRVVDRIDQEMNVIEGRRSAIRELSAVTDFSTLDFVVEESEIKKLRDELRALEEGSDAVRLLKARLIELGEKEKQLRKERDATVVAEDRLQTSIADGRRIIENASRARALVATTGSLEGHIALFPEIESHLDGIPLTIDDVLTRELPLRNALQGAATKLRREVEPQRDELCSMMNRYLRKFEEDSHDLDSKIEYLQSFCEMFDQIQRDDLPKHEQRFKERLNENVLREVGFLNGRFRTDRDEIETKIGLLNQSLRQVDYRVGVYMQLEPRPVRNHEIIQFQNELKECLANTFDGTPAADEARYVRIAKLVDRLRDDERWRLHVTDVRRWFDFAARELEIGTDRELACHEDSSGQSGGEKAKLAFTILVAAIAYQYDIDPTRPSSDKFHFVVVDEMFSKSDDRHSTYALELFKKFGLQLLIVAPLDAKARVTEPYVGSFLHVSKDSRTKCSSVIAMTAQDFETMLSAPDSEPAGTTA